MKRFLWVLPLAFLPVITGASPATFIRINQLGYTPKGVKVAVWCSKVDNTLKSFELINAASGKPAFSASAGKPFGVYGPFSQTYRLDFSSFRAKGRYYIRAGNTRSPEFTIDVNVYTGSADFCLRYMRQQRSGFNPFLIDSCHTKDGYVLYGQRGKIPDSTHVDVAGGWHDASDYLQYAMTSANATYHLLMAYRDFPKVFGDSYQANGLAGKNNRADVLDEAKWGLDWLLKMNPKPQWMFNQVGDDRDHIRMRLPGMDNQYGKGFERPVYFLSGTKQQRGKFLNNTDGAASTAAKFSSAFSLGSELLAATDSVFAHRIWLRAASALGYATNMPGASQTASVVSPYIYAEENWVDDMELAHAAMTRHVNFFSGPPDQQRMAFHLGAAFGFSKLEPVTPWLGRDTASHYQWYPFINVGHRELARLLNDARRDTLISFYREGITNVSNKAKANAFYRGIPFIWCSNNLTVSFAIQCYWYRELTGDQTFAELEQANLDWLFGCNPWGTSMVYGLPSWGDTPSDPHSAFTHIGKFPIDGGLVDGPVYTAIFRNLIGLQLYETDEYADFQSDLAVYHDDYGDYSTNEPTMDGTASLIYLLAAKEAESGLPKFSYHRGAIIRGDSTKKSIALVFTGHEYAEGGTRIRQSLQQEKVKASFFFTGAFYGNGQNAPLIQALKNGGHYLGAHSDKHLLYCDWTKRDSLLVTRNEFEEDLGANYAVMKKVGITKEGAHFFLPPYEWYNDSIACWTKSEGLLLINYTSGTLSHADYTVPTDNNYRSSETILTSILAYEKKKPSGLNGFILLMHVGVGPHRTDKFYESLPQLLRYLRARGYQFETVDELLK